MQHVNVHLAEYAVAILSVAPLASVPTMLAMEVSNADAGAILGRRGRNIAEITQVVAVFELALRPLYDFPILCPCCGLVLPLPGRHGQEHGGWEQGRGSISCFCLNTVMPPMCLVAVKLLLHQCSVLQKKDFTKGRHAQGCGVDFGNWRFVSMLEYFGRL